ncbi:MAG: hypothetical protein QW186_04900 [Candidatus Bathyarchaeia archaeon]
MARHEERFYVVDWEDNVIGYASRGECHKRGLIHRSVYIIVLNDRGEVFLQRRSPKKDLYPGYLPAQRAGT